MNWRCLIKGTEQGAEMHVLTEDSSMQEIEAAQLFILDRAEKDKPVEINIESTYLIDDEFIENLSDKVIPFQKAEGVKAYFLFMLSGHCHKGIEKDDLPTEQEIPQQ